MSVVGVIGLGRMGLPVCARLVQAGFDVLAADRDAQRRSEAENIGARWESSVSGVGEAADVLLTVLPGWPEVLEVMSEVLPLRRRGTAWIDLASTSPRVGEKLRRLAGDGECVDAPMGGGPEEARTGTLDLFVGGTPHAVEIHRSILETLGRVHHVGRPGAGQIVKLLVNLLWFGQAIAAGEALLVARRAGLELSNVQLALENSAADSRFIRQDLSALLDGDYLTNFGLDRAHEELDAITELADDLDVPFELSRTVRDLHALALARCGPADGELLGVSMLEAAAGTRLRRG